MKIEAEIHYSSPPAEVAEMTRQERFQELKCRATGAVSYDVEIDYADDQGTITTRREMPTDVLPDFAQAFLRDGLHVEEVDTWGPPAADGSRDGTISVTITGAPVAMTGTLTLRPTAGGAIGRLEADLVARIPLVGGRVEKAAAPAVLAAVRAEEKTAKRWAEGTTS